jgi:RNA polymerase subunit RPABC4/transcription elongation factor Spt4
MALIKCKECGHEVSDKASACPNCGCPLEMDCICKECGRLIPDGVDACPNCGFPIECVKTAYQEVVYEPRKNKVLIWSLIVAFLFLIVGGGFYAYTKLYNKTIADNVQQGEVISNSEEGKAVNSDSKTDELIEEKKTRFIGVFQFTDDQNLKWTITLNKDKTAVLYLKFEKVSFGQEGLTHYGSWIESDSYVLISFDEHTKVGFPSLRNYVMQMSLDKEGNYLYPSDMARSRNPETRLPLNKIN